MNKRYLHHIWRRLRPVNPWIFAILFIISIVVCVNALISNNKQMIVLREKVYQADEKGEGVEEALRDLRSFVYAHMNTSLTVSDTSIYPPLQLKHTYERLVNAERDRVAQANAEVYAKAQNICEDQFGAGQLASGRVPCVQQYVAANGVSEKPIPDALYKFDFVSPKWSPDLAGWGLLASILFGMLFILRWGTERWLRYELD